MVLTLLSFYISGSLVARRRSRDPVGPLGVGILMLYLMVWVLRCRVVVVRLLWVLVIRLRLLVSSNSGVDSVYNRDCVPRLLRTGSCWDIG